MPRRILTIVIALWCVAPLSGCSVPGFGESSSNEPTDPQAKAVVQRVEANAPKLETALVSGTVSFAVPQGAPAELLGGMNMAFKGATKRTADGAYDGRSDMTMDIANQKIALSSITVGGKTYLGYNGNYYEAPGTAGSMHSGDVAQLQQMLTSGALKDAKVEAPATIDGVEVEHLSATPSIDDFTKLGQQAYSLPGLQGTAGSQSIDQMKKVLKQVRIDYYVGKQDGFVRRVVLQMQMGAGGQNFNIQMTTSVTGINEPLQLDIAVPANAKPLSQFQNDLQQSMMSRLGSQGN